MGYAEERAVLTYMQVRISRPTCRSATSVPAEFARLHAEHERCPLLVGEHKRGHVGILRVPDHDLSGNCRDLDAGVGAAVAAAAPGRRILLGSIHCRFAPSK